MSEHPGRPAGGTSDRDHSPFRLLAERATDLISRHAPDGTYLYASPACRKLLGWQPEELIGRLVFDLFHPDDISAIAQSHERVINNDDDVAVIRYRIQRKDGTWTWFETTSHVIRNGSTGEPVEIQAVSRDISERVRAEERLRVTLEVLTDGVVVFGPDGAVQLANPAAVSILGQTADRLVEALQALRTEDGAPTPSPVESALTRGDEVTRRPLRYEHPDGRQRWLAVTTRVLDQLGERNVVVSLSDATAARAVEDQLRHLALHDPLTGLPNRTMLASHLEAALGRARRHGGRVGLLYIDLDGFKRVNDQWGHRAGDRLLIEVSRRLAASLRSCDLVARIGGDEFVLLCESLGDDHDAAAIARRVLATLDEVVDIGPAAVRPAASIGASVAGPSTSAELLLHEADDALYDAKRAGGGVAGLGRPAERAGTEVDPGTAGNT